MRGLMVKIEQFFTLLTKRGFVVILQITTILRYTFVFAETARAK
jgi:hypothetical protein